MNKKLMNKEDSQWIAQNMLLNYCLWDDDALMIESFIKNMEIPLNFNVNHFHFCITGLDKKYLPTYDPDSLYIGIQRTEGYYRRIEEILHAHHYIGSSFLLKVDNSKKHVIIFSEDGKADCPPEEIAAQFSPIFEHFRETRYIATSLVTNQSGYEQLNKAYMKANQLNNLTFFQPFDEVITEELLNEISIDCGLAAIDENIRKLQNIMCSSTLEEVLNQIELLFSNIIANSYNFTYFSTAFTLCKLLIEQFIETYHLKVTYAKWCDINQVNTLEDYVKELKKVMNEIFEQLNGKTIYSYRILHALCFIKNNFSKDLSLRSIAEYLGLNSTFLSSEFNREVGISISDYISKCRIEEAKKLLRQSDFTIADISLKVGFTNPKYFSLVFKQMTDLSPMQYRKK